MFIPHVVNRNFSKRPILLILDGHGSHLTDRMIELAIEHDIHLYCLPPHTTHRLQPLDVGVFGPLQRRWEERCDDVVVTTGESIQTEDVVKEYLTVRSMTFQTQTIIAAWAKTGIRPLNPSIFTHEDFAPSSDTSIKDHLPPSFPTAMPDFPDLSSDDFDWHPSMANVDGNDSSSDSEISESDTVIPSRTTTYPTISDNIETPLDDHSGSAGPSENADIRMGSHKPVQNSRQTRLTTSRASSTTHDAVKPVRGFNLCEAWDEIRRLRETVEEVEAQRDSAEAHCVLVQRELSTMRFRMNQKQKRKDRRFRTGSTLLTSEEGLKIWEDEKKRREERQQQEAVVQAEKQRVLEERNIERCAKATTGVFTGTLKAKRKGELEDIASAFGLSFEGTKATLTQRIIDHMKANPQLEQNPRFSGLYNAATTVQRRSGRAAIDTIDLQVQMTLPEASDTSMLPVGA